MTKRGTDAAEGQGFPVEFGEEVMLGARKLQQYVRAAFIGKRTVDSLTEQQLSVLAYLRAGPVPMSRLAQLQHISRAATTDMVDRLAARGLLERVIDPDDRRRFLIRLTPEGHRISVQALRKAGEQICELAAHLTPEEQRLLLLAMRAVNRLLLEQEGSSRIAASDGKSRAGLGAALD